MVNLQPILPPDGPAGDREPRAPPGPPQPAGGLDAVFSQLGFGRWTVSVYLIFIGWGLLLPYYTMGGALMNPVVDHWCHVAELDNSTWTLEQRLNYSVPWEERGGERRRSQCFVYDRDYEAAAGQPWTSDLQPDPEEASRWPLRPCDAWTYDNSTFTSTVSMEWDLVCERAGVSPFFQSLYYFGAAFGEPLLGCLADGFGRRLVVSVGAVMFGAVSLISALAPVLPLLLATRFLLGFLHPCASVSYVRAMEATPSRQRAAVGLALSLPFAFTGIMYGGWGYLFRDWRHLQLFCTIPVLLILALVPFMDESPRWLVVQGRVAEAVDILVKASRWQGDPLPPREQLIHKLQDLKITQEAASPHKGTEMQWRQRLQRWLEEASLLATSPTLRVITLGLFFCSFSIGFTFWGLSLSGVTFSNDPFLFMTLSCLMEVPGYIAPVPFVGVWGRRRVLAVCFLICCVAFLIILAIPKDYQLCILTLALVGKVAITSAYTMVYLLPSELFPTCLRSRGFNLTTMAARLGSIASPFVIGLLGEQSSWAPSLLFGGSAGLGCAVALLLPEPMNKPLADTVAELEMLYSSKAPPHADPPHTRPDHTLPDAVKEDTPFITASDSHESQV